VQASGEASITIDPATTALLLVDLQVGVTAMPTQPHSAETVVTNAARLVAAFRSAGGHVIFVRVSYGRENELQVRVNGDPNYRFDPPAGWDTLDPRLGALDDDTVVVKHVVSAFYGTDLDIQLRRRGITTLVVGGIATHMGVEGTVRSAHDRAYNQIFVHDAMSSTEAALHESALTKVFPMFGQVASTDDVVDALKGSS
jgi:nicotinamidase-related amidase